MDADDTSEVGPAAVLKQDTLCVNCGYNLRTLSREGRCPECGASVAASLVVGPFGGAGRRWLTRVAVGLALLLVANGVMVLAVALEQEGMDWMRVVFLAGPGGPKVTVAGSILEHIGAPWKESGPGWLAVLSLLFHAVGVALVMWPDERGVATRVKMIVLSGAASGALVVGVIAAAGWREMLPIRWSYREWLPWFLLLDAAAIVLMNLRIAKIAGRDKRRSLKTAMWVSMGAQVAGFLLLGAAVVKLDEWESVYISAGVLQAAGAAGASAISVWLVVVLMRARRRMN